jgi:hypothetical protein
MRIGVLMGGIAEAQRPVPSMAPAGRAAVSPGGNVVYIAGIMSSVAIAIVVAAMCWFIVGFSPKPPS